MDTIRQDLAYALRAMRRNPLVTAVIVITLAIGIGANTAIFTIVNAVLVRELPYEDSERLVALWMRPKEQPEQKMYAAYRDLEVLQASDGSFEDAAGFTWVASGRTLLWRGEPHRVVAVPSTQNLFSLLGVEAALGRTFVAEDLTGGCTAVISDRFWQSRFAADRGIIGGGITVDDETCTVVGVMPPAFELFPRATEIWTLITPASAVAANPLNGIAILGRLKDGVTLEVAETEAVRLHEGILAELSPESGLRETVLGVYDLKGEFTFLAGANLRNALLMLSAAVAMVLLICCANVAGILLSRGAERQKELALRAALGSGRARIVRQLLTESAVLAAAAAAFGALVATLAVRYFRAVNPIDLPVGSPVAMHWEVFAFTAAAGVLAALLFGMAPAMKMSRVDLNEVLKGASGARSRLGTGNGKLLVVGELSLSMVLLTGAALLIQSIDRLTAVPLSFQKDDLAMASVTLPNADYGENAQRSQFYHAVLERVAALPGVERVALSSSRPLGGLNGNVVTIAGKPPPVNDLGNVGLDQVSANFMSVMAIPLLRGRELDSRDREDSEQTVVVNQRFVDEYFPNEEPLGAQIRLGMVEANPGPWLTIVGVVGNTERSDFVNEMSFRIVPIAYRPIIQDAPRSMNLLIRTRTNAADIGTLVQREVNALDGRVPVHNLATMDEALSATFAQPRFRTQLLAVFAGLALLLAAVGVYGLLMRTVVQRYRDIGIRMALGADRRRVLVAVLRQGVTLAAIGIAIGIAASVYVTRFVTAMLYDVGAVDSQTLAMTSAVLVGATLVATYIPARAATRVDPLVALKHE